MAISLDGKRAVSASDDSTLRLWDLESGRAVLVLLGDAPFSSSAIDQEGLLIVAGDSLGGVHIVEIRNLPMGQAE